MQDRLELIKQIHQNLDQPDCAGLLSESHDINDSDKFYNGVPVGLEQEESLDQDFSQAFG